MKTNEVIESLLLNLEEIGNDLIASIATSNMNSKSLTYDADLLTYVKVIYDGLDESDVTKEMIKRIAQNNMEITKKMIIDTIKSNSVKFDHLDNDLEIVDVFLTGIKNSTSYKLVYKLEDIVERTLDDIVDGAENQVMNGEGIHGYLNLPFDGRLYLLQDFLENADCSDQDLQNNYPSIVKALKSSDSKKLEQVLSDGFNNAYLDRQDDINPKTTLAIVNELLEKD